MAGSDSEIKAKVQAQFSGSGDAYVVSPGHASGDDLARMIELANAAPDDEALDIATGGGHVARHLAPLCSRVVASDLTPAMLETARRFIEGEGLKNVEFAEADAESLPFADASFDVVTCRIAPHHFPNPDRFVSEVARVLRSGGRFVLIDTIVPPGPAGDRYNDFERVRDPSHVRSLPIQEWQTLMVESGLTVLRTEIFRKRHVFRDWALRARIPEAEVPSLARLLLDGGPEMASIVDIEREGDELIAFSDQKGLFLALKP